MFGSSSPDKGRPQEVVRKAPTIQVGPITKMLPPLPPNSMHDMRVDKLSLRMETRVGGLSDEVSGARRTAARVQQEQTCQRYNRRRDSR